MPHPHELVRSLQVEQSQEVLNVIRDMAIDALVATYQAPSMADVVAAQDCDAIITAACDLITEREINAILAAQYPETAKPPQVKAAAVHHQIRLLAKDFATLEKHIQTYHAQQEQIIEAEIDTVLAEKWLYVLSVIAAKAEETWYTVLNDPDNAHLLNPDGLPSLVGHACSLVTDETLKEEGFTDITAEAVHLHISLMVANFDTLMQLHTAYNELFTSEND